MNHIPRRAFLRQGAVLGLAFSVLPAYALRSASKIRIGVIGSGAFGQCYLPLLAAHTDIEIAALCEPDAGRRATAVQLAGRSPQWYDHWQQLVQQPQLDAVFIAAPWQWHAPMALAALQAGKHVLCGPVAATTPQQHQALVQASLQSGKQYITLQEADFTADLLALQAMVQQGIFGDIQQVHTGLHAAHLPGDVYAGLGAASAVHMLGVSHTNPFTELRLRKEQIDILALRKQEKHGARWVVKKGEIPVLEAITAQGQSLILQRPQRLQMPVAIGFRLRGSAGAWLEAGRTIQTAALQGGDNGNGYTNNGRSPQPAVVYPAGGVATGVTGGDCGGNAGIARSIDNAVPLPVWQAGRPFIEQYGCHPAGASPAALALQQAISTLQQGSKAAPAVYAATALSRLHAFARQAQRCGLSTVALPPYT